MIEVNWQQICKRSYSDKASINFDGSWALDAKNLDSENADRKFGTLTSYQNQFTLSVYQDFNFKNYKFKRSTTLNFDNLPKHKTIYGLNFSGVYCKAIDCFDASQPVFDHTDNLHQQVMMPQTVVFYPDYESVSADYDEVLVSFGKLQNFILSITIKNDTEICKISHKGKQVIISWIDYNSIPYFKLKFNHAINEIDAMEVSLKLERLLEVILGMPVNPLHIYLTNSENNLCKLFSQIDHSITDKKSDYREPCVTGGVDELATVISNWFSIDSNTKLKELIDHYIISIVFGNNIDDVLIDLTQGIDSYFAGEKVKVKPKEEVLESINKSKKIKKEIRDELKDKHLNELVKKIDNFYKNISPFIDKARNPPSENMKLKMKLDKFISDIPENIKKEMEKSILSGFINPDSHSKNITETWLDSIVSRRVNITHGESRKTALSNIESKDITNDILSVITRYKILKDLGAQSANANLNYLFMMISSKDYAWTQNIHDL